MWDFEVQREELIFGFRRYTAPTRKIMPVKTVEEANAMLSKASTPLRPKAYGVPAKIDDRTKALLCCTGRITHSPKNNGAWHITEYPTMYREVLTTGDTIKNYAPIIKLQFGHTYWNKNSKGRFLKWTYTIKNFKDVFEYYKKIYGVYKVPSEHAHRYPWRD